MEMTREDILRDFEAAKDKHKQIGILADLNQTTKENIVKILKEAGVDSNSLPHWKKPTSCCAGSRKAPKTIELPRIKPRAVHEAERMRELFGAISEAMLDGKKPPKAWVEEFDLLWTYWQEVAGV